MRLMARYLRPFFGGMALGFLIKVLGTLAELSLPYVLSYILDEVVPLASVEKILLWGCVMLVFAVAAMVCHVKANRMASRVARDATERIRHDLFRKTMYLSARQADEFTVPSLESRLTGDTYNVHKFLGMMQRLGVRAPILLIGGICLTATMDRTLTLVMLAVLPFIFLSVWLISRKGVPMYSEVQKRLDRLTRVVREDSQGIRVIKALSRTEYEKDRFDRVNEELVRVDRKAGTVMAASNPAMNLFLNLGLSAVIFVGALLISGGGSTKPGVIIAFMQYFTLLSNAMMSITRIFVMYTKAAASADRIGEVLQTGEDLPVFPETASEPEDPERFIEFDRVGFSYLGAKEDLSDLSFTLPKGKTLGIIGATGSGKSTLIQLLMRFYDVSSGSVRIGGRDVRAFPSGELRERFGAALQNDFIFAGTVRENLDFGRGLPEAQMRRALEIAQAAEYIDRFPDGWDHPLTSKGANLSGGQRQRLLIARALAGNPDILILDDSSSALDYKTDSNLRNALAESGNDSTKIMIAQRVSSVMNCDLILVLEEGRMIASGTHVELMECCPVYREISESQMGGAILE